MKLKKIKFYKLFKTKDNVSLWLQITAVALAVAIFLTGSMMLTWEAIVGRMYDGPFSASLGSGLDALFNEGDGTATEYDELDAINFDEEATDLGGEQIHEKDLSNLQDNIKSWMNTGTAVHESYVTNILLIGNDADSTRADAMLILSINHKTKTITLASLMRDQYSYIVHNNKGRFEKLHHACAYGGPTLQIQMLERYYKITIDNYAVVNFDTLPKIIDVVGGVEVNLTKAEADYMRSDWYCSRLKGAGTYTLNGKEALIYCRIRKGNTGGDTGRTSRQQEVVKKLISMAKNYSSSQMVAIANAAIPYIRTGLNSTEILGYATTALSDGWLNYKINQITLPDEGCSTSFYAITGGENLWYWKVDFPLAAQKLQTALYGQTNIVLDKNRKSWLK